MRIVESQIFISYAEPDEPWASWIAWELESAGYSVRLQAWDFAIGSNFVVEMHRNLDACDRVLLVLSPAFLRSAYTQSEWAHFFSRDPDGTARSIIGIRVAECAPSGLLATIVYEDLVGKAEEEARSSVLAAAALTPAGRPKRRKPSRAPAFPGGYPDPVKKRKDHEHQGGNRGIPRRTNEFRSDLRSPVRPDALRRVLLGRLVQVALDVSDLERARRLATAAITAGADLLEVGAPLVKRFGVAAITQLRSIHPGVPLVAEFSSSDWADEQVTLAADAGADLVILLGLNNPTRIERAVHAARKLEVGLIVGSTPTQISLEWCSLAEEMGVDGIAVIRNIDAASRPRDSFRQVRVVRQATSLPIAVSGGFSPRHIASALQDPWNIMIVGRAVIDSPDPSGVVEKIVQLVHQRRV